MNKGTFKQVFTVVFLALTLGALIMEFGAGLDSSDSTVPWTDLISNYIPQPITLAALTLLSTWLPTHFLHHYVGSTPTTRYNKVLVPAVVAGLTALTTALTDDQVTREEMGFILSAVLTGFGVYLVPNGRQPGRGDGIGDAPSPIGPAHSEPNDEAVAVLRERWQEERRRPTPRLRD